MIRRFVKTSSLIFACFLAMDILMAYQMNLRYQNDQAMAVSLKLAALRAHIEKQITENLLLVYGTANYISVNPNLSQAEFQQYAKGVMARQNLLKKPGSSPGFSAWTKTLFLHPLKNFLPWFIRKTLPW